VVAVRPSRHLFHNSYTTCTNDDDDDDDVGEIHRDEGKVKVKVS